MKYLFNAKKAGHAGTLDPLASGVLPIALGEATKTVPIVQDGVKVYRFAVKWGEETDTDDAEGRVVATSEQRPDAQAILALLPQFIGAISQVPPIYSAIKIGGERAYDLARDGADVVMEPREIVVHRLELVSSEPDAAIFEAECGKGTYVRAIARDIGRLLGCYGHVVLLRRTRVGPFSSDGAIVLDRLREAPDSWRVRRSCPLTQGWRNFPASRSTATAPPFCGVGRNCCYGAATHPAMGRPTLHALARRSPLASSRRAISCRRGCSTWGLRRRSSGRRR